MSLCCWQIFNSTNCCTKFRLHQISGFPNTANAKSGPLVLRDSGNILHKNKILDPWYCVTLEIFSVCSRKYLQGKNILHRNK